MAEINRNEYLGGSDVASILSLSPWQSAFMLYQKKIGEYVEEITPAKQKIFDRGHRWEEIVVEMLVDELEEQGHEVKIVARNQRYEDSQYPFIKAEIDVELLIDGEEVNGEAKTVSPFAAKAWGEVGTDEIPIYYACQVMHGLMVKPRRRSVVAALTGFDDKPRIHWVERDDDTIAIIRAKELEFWQRIQTRNPPDPVTLEDVSYLFQRDLGTILEADDNLLALCQEIKRLKADAKDLDGLITEMTTNLKKIIGDAATVQYSGCTIASWKNNKPSENINLSAAIYDFFNWLKSYKDNPQMRGIEDVLSQCIRENTKTVPGIRPLRLK
jgi:putative phage-type endonuclease